MARSGTNRRLILSYGIAVAGVMVAGLTPWWLSPLIGATPPMRLMLVMVVTATAWLGGAGPGLLATALGLVAIVAGDDSPGDKPALLIRLARFGILALLIDAVFAVVHVQRRRAEQRERELRRAERALREATSLLRSFYESSSTAMGVIEVTDDDARIVSANAPTGRLFGREPGEVEGQAVRALGVPPDRLSDWLDHARRCRATGKPVRLEQRGACPTSPEWIAITLSAMDSPETGGTLCSFLVEDITEHKRIEDDLRVAKEQAEAASRAKDRFLAVLSHELRTPLTPSLLAVSSLIESGPDPAIVPALEMIRRNIALESRLIDDLLDLSRIARGRLRLDLEIVDVHEALRPAVEICLDMTFVAGLEVATELEAPEHHVTGDQARITQIAWNLVRNAAKFTPAGGRLTIRTSNAPSDRAGADAGSCPFAPGGPGLLVVEFEDDGIGIAPAVLPRIFEAFEQGEHDLRGRSQGLGLGLAICRSLAEAMDGRLTATSAGVGLGSTFRLELDAVPAPAPPSPALSPAPTATRPAPRARSECPRPAQEPGLRVLLVEDNEDTLRFLATLLRGRGHEVVTADTIAAARRAASRAERPFDLLLSDIELPDGLGLMLMPQLSGRDGLRGIAMSGFGAEEDVQLSREAGFLEHLIKPIEPHRLDAAIRRARAAARAGTIDDEDETALSPTRGGDSGPFRVISTHEA